MPPTGSTLLGQLLNAFVFTLTGGYARTVGDVYNLLILLASIELIVAAVGWYFLRTGMLLEMMWKMVGFSFLFWIVEQWPVLLKTLRDGFIDFGLLIGGSVLTTNDITDPGNLIDFGFSVTAVLFNKLSQLNLITNGFIVIIGGLAGWIVVLLYCMMAMHLFMALLEYYIVGACLILLVPFLAHQKTAFLGEGVFSTFFMHARRLMIYAAILSITLPVMYTWQLPLDPGLKDVGMLFAGALTMFSIVASAPHLASGTLHGGGVFSWSNMLFGAASLAQTSAAVGAVGAAASFAGAGAIRGAVSGLSAMHAAAQTGAAAYRATHSYSSADGGRRVSSAVIGGAQGMAQYAAGRVMAGFSAAVESGRARARRTME